MVSNKYPFSGDTIYSLLATIGKGVFSMPEGLSEMCTDLISSLMSVDPNCRPAFSELLHHEWLLPRALPTARIPVSQHKGAYAEKYRTTMVPFLDQFIRDTERKSSNQTSTSHINANSEFRRGSIGAESIHAADISLQPNRRKAWMQGIGFPRCSS